MFVATLGGKRRKTVQKVVTVMSAAGCPGGGGGDKTVPALRRSGFCAASTTSARMIDDGEPGLDFEVLPKRPRRELDSADNTISANTEYIHFPKYEKTVSDTLEPGAPCDDASAALLDPFGGAPGGAGLFGPDAAVVDVWDPLLPGRDIEAETTSLSDMASTAATSDLFTPPMTPPQLAHALGPPEFPPVPRGTKSTSKVINSTVTASTEPRPSVPFLTPGSAAQAVLNTLTSRVRALVELTAAAANEQREAAGALAQMVRHRRSTGGTHAEQCERLERLVARRELLLEEGEQVDDAVAALFDTSVLAPAELACWAELGALLRCTLTELTVHNTEARALVQQQQQGGTDSVLVVMLPVLKRSVMKGNTMLFSLADVRALGFDQKSNNNSNGTTVNVDAVVEGTNKKESLDVVFQSTQMRTTTTTTTTTGEGGAGQLVVSVRCPSGSNKRPVRLLFSGSTSGRARAALSEPVIVVTNSAQWHDAEGILLSRELFGDYAAVTWAHFCNTLQWWMVDATKQRLGDARRALTAAELAYLGAKACAPSSTVKADATAEKATAAAATNTSNVIAASSWETFWGFFGACMEKLRHQRNLTPMWQRGLVMGFGTKADAARVLAGQPDGAFVVRFSDTFPGVFAADFVFGGAVHHVLIRDHDASGSKRSVMEFLHDAPYLTQVVSVVPAPAVADRLVPGPRVSKAALLREYFLTRPLRGQNPAAPPQAAPAARYEDADTFLATVHPSLALPLQPQQPLPSHHHHNHNHKQQQD